MTDRSTNSAAREPVVGIDLGTTFSLVAWVDATDRPMTIMNAEGDLSTPSVVFFDRSGVVVGKEAARAAEFEPERVAQFAKRDMGRVSFHRTIRGEPLPPEVIQALILKKLREDAELKIGPVRKAVVTVPAYFDEPRRKATQDAGQLAGLEVLDILNEPTAAAISFGVQQGFVKLDGSQTQKETVLVYDLGGGTFDVTLMDIEGHQFTALGTAGDVYLGGIDWTERIVDLVGEQFLSEHGVDPRVDESALQSLQVEAENAKRALTARDEATLMFAHEGQRLRVSVTRSQFEEMTGDLRDRTLFTVRKVLRESGKSWSDVSRLLLVGGSSRMPAVQKALEAESGLKVDRSLSPDEAVAHGAAVYAALLAGRKTEQIADLSVRNVNSHDLGVLGVESETGRKRRGIMIPRNTQLPCKAKSKFKTFRDGQKSVVVNVVEGGDDSGNNATPIGTCTVTGLPENLPARTPVEVVFRYTGNGRIKVEATLPTLKRKAEMSIERASGLDAEALKYWQRRIEQGLNDESLTVSGPPPVKAAASQSAESAKPAGKTSAAAPESIPGPASGTGGADAPRSADSPSTQSAPVKRERSVKAPGRRKVPGAATGQSHDSPAAAQGNRNETQQKNTTAARQTRRRADRSVADAGAVGPGAVDAGAVDAGAVGPGAVDAGSVAAVESKIPVENAQVPAAPSTDVAATPDTPPAVRQPPARKLQTPGKQPSARKLQAPGKQLPPGKQPPARKLQADASSRSVDATGPIESQKSDAVVPGRITPGEAGPSMPVVVAADVPSGTPASIDPVREADEVPLATGMADKVSAVAVADPGIEVSAEAEDEWQAAEQIRQRKRALKAMSVNVLLHALLLMILAMIILPPSGASEIFEIVTSVSDEVPDEEMVEEVEIQPDQIQDETQAEVVTDVITETEDKFQIDINDLAPAMTEVKEAVLDSGSSNVAPVTGEMGGRSQAGKTALVLKYGGSAESEAAVGAGLQWLKRHQRPNGSWHFNHAVPGCDGTCNAAGSFKASTGGATALALLAYMGAGHTYTSGEHQLSVEKGLNYILDNARPVPAGLDLRSDAEGNSGMYIQGIATICLSEAAALNESALRLAAGKSGPIGVKSRKQVVKDTHRLKQAAQAALAFIVAAQNSRGGWRYRPEDQSADTSVVGWQVMALASGKSAGLTIPGQTLIGVRRFLNQVTPDEGVTYGYDKPGTRPSTTAIGLLCQMYLGWTREHPSLAGGVEYLSKRGPDRGNMYYNYYATQVMHHWGGEEWKKWNEFMREHLVSTQVRKGHGSGSWNVADSHGGAGGRLYMTCLATMTLEVYYRHLPLYEHMDGIANAR